MKRSYQSGAQKKKKKKTREEELKKTKTITSFFGSEKNELKNTKENDNDIIVSNDAISEQASFSGDIHLNTDTVREDTGENVVFVADEDNSSKGEGAVSEENKESTNVNFCYEGELAEGVSVSLNDLCEDAIRDDYDIGFYLARQPTDLIKYHVLCTKWKAPPNFEWPHSNQMQNGSLKKRYLRQDHIETHPEFAYSVSKSGIYCKFCVFQYHTSHPSSGCLVTEPLNRYDRLAGITGDLEKHSSRQYHLDANAKCLSFLEQYKYKTDVLKQQDNSHKKLCEENREKIKPIIETVLFLGQNTLPFRNSESNILDLNDLQHQEGLFRRLLRFRVQSGDENLRKHLENAPKNAVYTSPKIQNAFISCIGQEIQDNVLQKI